MKKNIILVLVVVLFFVGLAYFGKVAQKATPIASGTEKVGNGSLSADEKFYDFGSISMKNGKVSRLFKVSNLTDEDVFLERVTTSCMCTVAYVINGEDKKGPFGMAGHGGAVLKVNDTIKAGETREIEVVFDPNAHGPAGVGLIDRIITLADKNGEELNLEIKAVVTP
ncbi:MAG TPA: DUF1573 domain-containing protein [Nanoarchaeota archaeon]|nr:DUF1573 domain-containing protein [Nanoarchaeota archaeon]